MCVLLWMLEDNIYIVEYIIIKRGSFKTKLEQSLLSYEELVSILK